MNMRISITLKLPGGGNQTAALVAREPFTTLPMMVSGHVVLLDKNVLRRAEKTQGRSCADEPSRIWLNQLNRPDIALNPILHAMEGCGRRIPDRPEFMTAFADGLRLCRELFPKAQLVDFPIEVWPSLYEVSDFLARRHAAELAFLRWLAPKAAHPIAERKRWALAENVVDNALELGLEASSLTVLLGLALLFDRGSNAPAKPVAAGIIKPRARYNDGMAHNALSDIRALEFLASAGMVSGPPVALCTSDLPMIQLWRALRITDMAVRAHKFIGIVRLSPALFPLLDDDGCNTLRTVIEQRSCRA